MGAALRGSNHGVTPVVIAGMGCICACGNTLSDCMDAMYSGKRTPEAPTLFSTDHPASYPVFEVQKGFLEEDESLYRTNQLALNATYQAVTDSNVSLEELRGQRVGVCIGTTVGSALNDETFYGQYARGETTDLTPIRRFLANNPARTIAHALGLTGPCQTVVNACSSGTDAIGIAASWIRFGVCERVICGGADELSRVTYNGFISLMVHSNEACRPFDMNRKGLNLGEGAGIMILESEAAAARRKVCVQGRILGYGAASDAHHLTAPHPEGLGLQAALRAALKASAVEREDIEFVNVHGTGTCENDKVEAAVLKDLLPGVPFTSTKAYTGHTLGAAGSLEAIFTLACLENQMLPATAGFTETDPDCGVGPVTQNTRISGDVALSESLAFGGTNSVVIMGRGE